MPVPALSLACRAIRGKAHDSHTDHDRIRPRLETDPARGADPGRDLSARRFRNRGPLKQGRLWLGLGLLAGSAGDAFLALEPTQQALGILAFAIGHLIYIGLFADQLRRKGNRGLPGYLATGVIIVFGALMLVALQPHFGELRIAASIYNGIILVMVALALIGRAPKLAVIGALLFLVSDAVLAWRMFAGMLDWAGPVVWVCYFGGQACIALGLSHPEDSARN